MGHLYLETIPISDILFNFIHDTKNMKRLILLLLFVTLANALFSQQRIIAECTITYNIAVSDTVSLTMQNALKASSKTVYVKGNESRVDLVSPAFSQSVIYDKTEGTATILREFGSNKFISTLDNDKWIEVNKQFDGLSIETTEEHKTILGYDCVKAFLHLKDSSIYTVYYTPSIIPSVKEFEYQFKDISGLVLSYEALGTKGEKLTYTASKVNLSPVPANVFSIPSSGYRVL